MTLFSLVVALLIEQLRPLPYRRVVYDPLARLARFLEQIFNAGERSQGVLAWFLAVGGLVLLAGGVSAALHAYSVLLAALWNVTILYLTMGFRQFSHEYSYIQLALRTGDLAQARKLLAQWRRRPADDLSSSEIARLAIEEALCASHRHVFGVLVCFVLLPGPCGAVLYRAAAFLAEVWGRRSDADGGALHHLVAHAGIDPAEPGDERGPAARVLDDDDLPEPAIGTGEGDPPGGRGLRRRERVARYTSIKA